MSADLPHQDRAYVLLEAAMRGVRVALGGLGLILVAGLLVASIGALLTDEHRELWWLVGFGWLIAAGVWPPFARVRADVGNMRPLGWGDMLCASGSGYALAGPQYGDLAVVWIHPALQPVGRRYVGEVRRVVGLPRDRIAISNGALFRNGTPVDESTTSEVPREWSDDEIIVPDRHYLLLPEQRGTIRSDGFGWLLERTHLLGRVWFMASPLGGVRTAGRARPWLELVATVLGPPARFLHCCWAQVRQNELPPTLTDDEPNEVHAWCEQCRRTTFPSHMKSWKLPPGFRWVSPWDRHSPR